MASTATTAKARSLSKAISAVGLENKDGKKVTHTQALNILAKMDGYEAHSHRSVADVTVESEIPVSKSSLSLNSIAKAFLASEHKIYTHAKWRDSMVSGLPEMPYQAWVFQQCMIHDTFASIGKTATADTQYIEAYYRQCLNAVLAVGTFKGSAPEVRVSHIGKGAETWKMEVNLSTRWGEFNDYAVYNKPGLAMVILLGLEGVALLQEAMAEEMCFIGVKDNEIGLFAEIELELEDQDLSKFEKDFLATGIVSKYPEVCFALPNIDDYSAAHRQAFHAFISYDVLRKKGSDSKKFVQAICDELINFVY